MKKRLLIICILLYTYVAYSQQLQLMDRFNGNTLVNDSTITIYDSDPATIVLTKYLTLKNTTDKPLAVFLKKTVNFMNDSTSDYFCFGISCWPNAQITDIADSIQPGAKDSTFASHVTHIRRFELPLLPPGKSSVTYTFFDSTTFNQPVHATVTIIYHLSGLGLEENFIDALKVYPNPANDLLNIVLPDSQGMNSSNYISGVQNEAPFKAYTLNLFNSTGVCVYNNEIFPQGDKISISVKSYPAGIYYGMLLSRNGKKLSFNFVKN
ncbi:MAG: T9SS type A sorting domain-containing protein [Omnitrophica WOR_2 bacterium]|jgi:hypothetical protein